MLIDCWVIILCFNQRLEVLRQFVFFHIVVIFDSCALLMLSFEAAFDICINCHDLWSVEWNSFVAIFLSEIRSQSSVFLLYSVNSIKCIVTLYLGCLYLRLKWLQCLKFVIFDRRVVGFPWNHRFLMNRRCWSSPNCHHWWKIRGRRYFSTSYWNVICFFPSSNLVWISYLGCCQLT